VKEIDTKKGGHTSEKDNCTGEKDVCSQSGTDCTVYHANMGRKMYNPLLATVEPPNKNTLGPTTLSLVERLSFSRVYGKVAQNSVLYTQPKTLYTVPAPFACFGRIRHVKHTDTTGEGATFSYLPR